MPLHIALYRELINSSNTTNIKPNQLDLFEEKTHFLHSLLHLKYLKTGLYYIDWLDLNFFLI